jgi:hypothetical protein
MLTRGLPPKFVPTGCYMLFLPDPAGVPSAGNGKFWRRERGRELRD